jgi:uncharacterized protein
MITTTHTTWRRILPAVTVAALACGLLISSWTLAGQAATGDRGNQPGSEADAEKEKGKEISAMQVFYLEVVTKEVGAVCAAYAAATGVQFGQPVEGLGKARTAAMPGGGWVGVRAPLRDTEAPVVRPYWLVDDIEAAVAAAVKAGGQVAHPPLEIPGYGTFAIYVQGGNDHGLWQK